MTIVRISSNEELLAPSPLWVIPDYPEWGTLDLVFDSRRTTNRLITRLDGEIYQIASAPHGHWLSLLCPRYTQHSAGWTIIKQTFPQRTELVERWRSRLLEVLTECVL